MDIKEFGRGNMETRHFNDRFCHTCGKLHHYNGPCVTLQEGDKDLKRMLPKIDQYNMTAVFQGFSSHDIKQMIESTYGAVMWEYLDDGKSVVCYPTSTGKVTVVHQEPT